MGVEEHRKEAVAQVRLGILTLSSTRTQADDDSGNWIAEQARNAGHEVICHEVLPDHVGTIRQTVLDVTCEYRPHVLLLNGGTGITPKDVTIEAVRPLFQKELTGFGSLFAMLSFEEIGSAAILSRATAGVIRRTVIFCMPGSLKACQLACNRIIFPELGHMVKHIHD